jgi:hypothetical protein
MLLSVPAPVTNSGKVYQYSPNPEASPRLFLIGEAPADRVVAEEHRGLIRRAPGPGQTVCPYSGYTAPDDEFVHFDDIEAVKEQIIWAAGEDVGDYLEQMATDFNRSQPRNALFSVNMDVKRPRRSRRAPLREDLLRNLDCDICRRPYGVYAIALFCPDCGAPNLTVHFRQEAQLVCDQIAVAGEQDVLTAFETALKTVYRYLVREHRPGPAAELLSSKLVFQKIDRIREHFAVLDIDPFSAVTPADLELLTLNIQKRHVIGHNLGIADEHYTQFAQGEQPGETVALLGDDINRFADGCLKVVIQLEAWLLPSAVLPTGDQGG